MPVANAQFSHSDEEAMTPPNQPLFITEDSTVPESMQVALRM
jgi:hypothetical protein